MRLFIALPLPEEAKISLSAIQSELRCSKAQMRMVSRENLHMTLRFIGEGDPGEWIGRMDEIGRGEFDLLFDRIGAFPDAAHARVVWAGCEAPESLLKIQRVIADDGPVPHVTLARVRGRPDAALISLVGKGIGVPAHITSVRLMDSTLGPDGPRYEVVYEKAL